MNFLIICFSALSLADSSFIISYQDFKSDVTFNSYFGANSSANSNLNRHGGTPTRHLARGWIDDDTGHEDRNYQLESGEFFREKDFPLTFDFSKHPIDFYYLMDGTQAFSPDREVLKGLVPNLKDTLRGLSRDAHIGFGYFGDKWTDWDYGVINKLPLTSDFGNFRNALNVLFTYGGDDENDLLTGLHQMIKCNGEVKWRNNSMRMLFVTTNNDYHEEGHNGFRDYQYDDKYCQLDRNGLYNGKRYDKADYPSVDHVKRALKENAVKVIFGVQGGRKVEDIYKGLAVQLSLTPIVLPLDGDSRDVISVIEKAFDMYKKEVVLETLLTGPRDLYTKIQYEVTCGRKYIAIEDEPETTTKTCRLLSNKIVEFNLRVKLPCPWTFTNVKLKTHIMGLSVWNDIDLASVCPLIDYIRPE